MNTFRLNILSLKYQRFSQSGCEDIGLRKFEFVAKIQFLCIIISPDCVQVRAPGWYEHLLLDPDFKVQSEQGLNVMIWRER